MTALYIHIPFCVKKCAYCDFTSFPGCENRWAPYLNALEKEIKSAARTYGRLDISTIFIGGGTPSLLPSDAVMRLIAISRAFFRVDSDAEISVEANPGTITLEKLRDYRACGVNRLSIGMQASQPRLLQLLGRIHTYAQVVESVTLTRQAGFQNLNLDLMYALPNQSMADWVETLRQALSLNPEHLSLYSLILEEGTPLAQQVESGALSVPDDDLCVSMQHAAQRILLRRGYHRYEISNYSKPGYECRHNLAYWNRGDYLGVGLAAHSFMEGVRFSNTADLDAYIAGERQQERNMISPQEAWEETVMLSTRTTLGIDLSLLNGRETTVHRLRQLGLIDISRGRLTLTDRGMDVQNAVVLELIKPTDS